MKIINFKPIQFIDIKNVIDLLIILILILIVILFFIDFYCIFLSIIIFSIKCNTFIFIIFTYHF